MKLIGSRRKSKHAGKEEKSSVTSVKNGKTNKNEKSLSKSKKSKMSRGKKILLVTSIVICTILLLLGSLLAIIRWEIQPFYDIFFPMPGANVLGNLRTPTPTPNDDPNNPVDPNAPTPTPDDRYHGDDGDLLPIEQIRNMNIITFMCFGIDEFGNTDVIMVGAFNTDDYTVNIVSIPRDTLMNTPWDTPYYAKKANFIQPKMRRDHDPNRTSEGYATAMENALDHFETIFGFNIDFWFTVNMSAFVSVVNSLPEGGVRFNVPFSFQWTDLSGRIITIPSGNQVLNGAQSLALLRQRYNPNTGASYGDFWRINNQQVFLKSAADQILTNRNFNIVNMADIFIRHARTDMQLDHMIRIGREFLKVDSSNITFVTLPGQMYSEFIAIDVDEWLEILNTKLNPFNFDIEATDLSILTLDSNRSLYVTDDDWQGRRTWRPNIPQQQQPTDPDHDLDP